jgi:alcohol dehydrogenase
MTEYLDVDFKVAMREILHHNNYRTILMVTGKHSFDQSPVPGFVQEISTGLTIRRFSDFRTNPRFEDVAVALNELASVRYDAIWAVGGGSVMDFAKVLSMYLNCPALFDRQFYDSSRIDHVLPIIAVPTTAGSGSEATHFAVLYKDSQKYSLVHKDILPAYTIVDPSLSRDMPTPLAASTGIDAFAQALESCWSKGHTAESIHFAKNALNCVMPHLVDAVFHKSAEAGRMMALGAFYGGKAINITRTTGPHAMSYYLSMQHDVPHGEAVGMNLCYFTATNYAWLPEEIRDTLSHWCGALGPEALTDWIAGVQKDIGLRSRITQIDADWSLEITRYLSSINAERMGNNPSAFDPDHFRAYHSL